jgi:hypothetical protein
MGFSPVLWFSRVGKIPLMLYSRLHLHVAFTEWTNGRNLETFKKAMVFWKPGGGGRHWIDKYFDLVVSWLSPVLKLMLRWFPSWCCMHFIQSSGFNFIKIKLIALKLEITKLTWQIMSFRINGKFVFRGLYFEILMSSF